MTTRVGVFGDMVGACTGFSVVLTNLAVQLATHPIQVIYFGRFGLPQEQKGLGKSEIKHNFLYVKAEGGVWRKETVIEAIKKYKLDLVFSEDDFYSAYGLLDACKECKVPFFFLTPIDSIPVQFEGLQLFKKCDRVFVPTNGASRYLKGKGVSSIPLPHGVHTNMFKPLKIQKPEGITFIWVGRDGRRKALGRTLLAYEKLLKDGYKANLLVRIDWTTPVAQRTLRYINNKNLPVIMEQQSNCPHEELVYTYNRGDVFVCSAKAGGFELGLIEAASCGLATVCTNHTFMNEQVLHEKSGLLVGLEKQVISHYGSLWGNIDIGELCNAMKYYVDYPELARIHGNFGRAWVKQQFNWKSSGDKLYGEITKASSRH